MKPRRVFITIEATSSEPIKEIIEEIGNPGFHMCSKFLACLLYDLKIHQIQVNVKRPERKIRLRMRGRNYSARGFAAAIRSEKQKGKS